jgi:hypothetical protein
MIRMPYKDRARADELLAQAGVCRQAPSRTRRRLPDCLTRRLAARGDPTP